jgi:general secretion pathway protein D
MHLARCLAAALTLAATVTTAHADREQPVTAARDDDGDDSRFACAKPRTAFEVGFADEVGVKDLVTWAMGISCKRFVYASGVGARSAKLTMITPGKLDAGQAWALFETALDSMGLAVVAKGPIYEIVEATSAKDAALAIRRSFPDGGGSAMRLLLRPQHASVEDLKSALELVKSKAGIVTPLPNLHALLITDDGRHIARMKTLVDELDRPGDGAGVWAVPVQYRDPDALIEVLTPLLATPASGATPAREPKLVADRRARAVFVVGAAADYQRVAALVGVLDRDQGDAAAMTAIRLRNARAAEVVAALAPLTNGGGDKAVVGTVKLAADPGTNAVLIQASPQDTLAVRAMLDELDAPRRQVYVEAMVLEVSEATNRALGAAWHLGTDTSAGGVALGGFQTTTLSSVTAASSLASAGAGALGGILGSALDSTLLGESVPSFGVLLQAVATDSQIEVLASPHLMMLDNTPATISVGANIPYLSRTAATGSLASTGASIDREKVALTLKITPHVAPAEPGAPAGSDRIRLEVALEHNQLGDSDFEGLGPTWKERKLETAVVVGDQDNLVLGGLIDERVEDSNERIPLLGDLPVIGALFRSTKHVRTKSNLLIVLTPHLIDDSAEGRAVFERRMRERQEFLRARSALSTRVAAPAVDYRKKRGVVAEIDAQVRAIEAERATRDALRTSPPPQGRVDVARPPPATTPPS